MTLNINRPTISRTRRQNIAGPPAGVGCTGNSNPTFFLVLWFPKG